MELENGIFRTFSREILGSPFAPRIPSCAMSSLSLTLSRARVIHAVIRYASNACAVLHALARVCFNKCNFPLYTSSVKSFCRDIVLARVCIQAQPRTFESVDRSSLFRRTARN